MRFYVPSVFLLAEHRTDSWPGGEGEGDGDGDEKENKQFPRRDNERRREDGVDSTEPPSWLTVQYPLDMGL
jgi:hypothetical protein